MEHSIDNELLVINTLVYVDQAFKVKSRTMITGNAAAQSAFGSQYTGGARQWDINNLEDLIKCH